MIRRPHWSLLAIGLAALSLGVLTFSRSDCFAPEGGRSSMTAAELREEIARQYAGYRDSFPGIGEISADELAALRQKQEVVVVDVREPKEQAVSMIPGAITQQEFESHLDAYRGKTIVTHCTIGYRSGVYTEELRKRGIESRNLKGSILAWVAAGYPVVDSKGSPTKRVHVYGKDWNMLPQGYEGVW